MALILAGFACAGKTTLGQKVAAKLSLPFFDTDQLLEQQEGKRVTQLWKEKGELYFRAVETKVIGSLSQIPSIIALGGGALIREENRTYLKQLGKALYLKASPSFLYERLLKRGLPAYLNGQDPFTHFQEIAGRRFPLYEAFCAGIIEVEHWTEEECLKKISEKVDGFQ